MIGQSLGWTSRTKASMAVLSFSRALGVLGPSVARISRKFSKSSRNDEASCGAPSAPSVRTLSPSRTVHFLLSLGLEAFFR